MGKLSKTEVMIAEGRNRVKKLEEDNEKLRRALEQSMTRLNRMSVDSDFLVDRLDCLHSAYITLDSRFRGSLRRTRSFALLFGPSFKRCHEPTNRLLTSLCFFVAGSFHYLYCI